MPDDSYRTIRTLLASTKPEKLREGLKLAELEVAKVGSSEARPLFEMVSTLFWVIPILVDNLDEGDLKAQWATAHVLGRIGTAAIAPLLTEYESAANPTLRAFILYALGKVKVPGIVQAAPAALEAARSANLELRDTATRALGKFVESIPRASLSEKMKRRFIECLRGNLSDTNASVRAKAIRSLGKMAKHGHLTESERMQLKAVCRRITGTDEDNEWDRAYVVRKEAAEALTHLE